MRAFRASANLAVHAVGLWPYLANLKISAIVSPSMSICTSTNFATLLPYYPPFCLLACIPTSVFDSVFDSMFDSALLPESAECGAVGSEDVREPSSAELPPKYDARVTKNKWRLTFEPKDAIWGVVNTTILLPVMVSFTAIVFQVCCGLLKGVLWMEVLLYTVASYGCLLLLFSAFI